MKSEVVRSLENGSNYAPDWRAQVGRIYLAENAKAPDPATRLREILDDERDPFVRRFLRFRFDGTSVKTEAFNYAQGCHARNRTIGAANMILAMVVADHTPEEIAEELGTKRINIVTFEKVFSMSAASSTTNPGCCVS